MQEGDYTYQVLDDGTAEITAYYGDDMEIVIPDTIGGYTVTRISDFAFYYDSNLRSIELPEGVTSIDDGAFRGCSSLTDAYYEGSEAEWNNIEVDYGNDLLTSATIHYDSGHTEISNVFQDINSDDWFYDAVSYVYTNNIITGMNETTYAPYAPLNRTQFAVILYRINSSPEVEYTA